MTMRQRDPLTPAQEARFSWPDYPLHRTLAKQRNAARWSEQCRIRLAPLLSTGRWSEESKRLARILQDDDARQYRQARDAYDLWRSTLRGQRVPSQEPTQ